jgi:hypothetical protein
VIHDGQLLTIHEEVRFNGRFLVVYQFPLLEPLPAGSYAPLADNDWDNPAMMGEIPLEDVGVGPASVPTIVAPTPNPGPSDPEPPVADMFPRDPRIYAENGTLVLIWVQEEGFLGYTTWSGNAFEDPEYVHFEWSKLEQTRKSILTRVRRGEHLR